ncbi:uncharacterized protein EI97DRAFT_479187, partial [Westerdykella ornata]
SICLLKETKTKTRVLDPTTQHSQSTSIHRLLHDCPNMIRVTCSPGRRMLARRRARVIRRRAAPIVVGLDARVLAVGAGTVTERRRRESICRLALIMVRLLGRVVAVGAVTGKGIRKIRRLVRIPITALARFTTPGIATRKKIPITRRRTPIIIPFHRRLTMLRSLVQSPDNMITPSHSHQISTETLLNPKLHGIVQHCRLLLKVLLLVLCETLHIIDGKGFRTVSPVAETEGVSGVAAAGHDEGWWCAGWLGIGGGIGGDGCVISECDNDSAVKGVRTGIRRVQVVEVEWRRRTWEV